MVPPSSKWSRWIDTHAEAPPLARDPMRALTGPAGLLRLEGQWPSFGFTAEQLSGMGQVTCRLAHFDVGRAFRQSKRS
jgi:hypothetical protein